MTTTSLPRSATSVEVASTDTHATPAQQQAAWTAWLHGTVAAVRDGDRLVLLVPMRQPTPAAVALARRLHDVGTVTVLD